MNFQYTRNFHKNKHSKLALQLALARLSSRVPSCHYALNHNLRVPCRARETRREQQAAARKNIKGWSSLNAIRSTLCVMPKMKLLVVDSLAS